MKKTLLSLTLSLLLAPALSAADNGTEFYMEDDLTVKGTQGSQTDPDVEIKGFTVFGSTQSTPALSIPAAPGNVFMNGYVQVSSGMYVAAGTTIAARLSVANANVQASSYTLTVSTGGSFYHLLVTTAGQVGIGGEPHSLLHVVGYGENSGAVVENVEPWGTDLLNGPYLALLRGRGDRDSQEIVQNADGLGGILFAGHDGSVGGADGPYRYSSLIRGRVDGTAMAGSVPGALDFYTSPGAEVLYPRLTIRADGGVGISTGIPQASLDVLSTGTIAQIWRNSSGMVVASMSATGVLSAVINNSTVSAYSLAVSTGFGPILHVSSAGLQVGLYPSTKTALSVFTYAYDYENGEDIITGVNSRVQTRGTQYDDVLVAGNFESEVSNSGHAKFAAGLRAAVRVETGADPSQVAGILVDDFDNEGTVGTTYGVYIGTVTDGNQAAAYPLYSASTIAVSYFGGPVGIGTGTVKGLLSLVSTQGDDYALDIQQFGPGNPAGVILLRSNGTPAARASVTNGQQLSDFRMFAYDGGDYSEAASFGATVDGNVIANSVPGSLEFRTTQQGTGMAQPRLIIKNDGRVGIISTAAVAATLDVQAAVSHTTVPVQAWRSYDGRIVSSMTEGGQLFVSTLVVGNFSGMHVSTDVALRIAARAYNVGGAQEDVGVGLEINAWSGAQGSPNSTNDMVVGANMEAAAFQHDSLDTLAALRLQLRRETSGSGVVKNGAALWIDDLYTDSGVGAMTNTYGVYIGSLAYSNQTNKPYAVYSVDPQARSYFSGYIGISSASPAYALSISSAAGSSNIMVAVSTGDTNVFTVDGAGEVRARRFFGDGSLLTGISASDSTKVLRTGDTITGAYDLRYSTLMVTNDTTFFSVKGSGLLSTGTYAANTPIPASGNGERFMWWPSRAAIRAGGISAAQWDDGNVGAYSAAFGYDNKASGSFSAVAGGYGNEATGQMAFAGGGNYNKAREEYSAALGGAYNLASASNSVVSGGVYNVAHGTSSVASGGEYNSATGKYSTVGGGYSNSASGNRATVAGGENNNISGDYTFVGGGYDNDIPGSSG